MEERLASSIAGSKEGNRALDISGQDNGMVVKTWAIIGCVFLAFLSYVIYKWVTAPYFGPTPVPEGVEVPLRMKIAIRALEIGFPLAWLYFIYTQIIKPIRQTGQPNTLGLIGVAWFCAIPWDPSCNWIQMHAGYNSYALNVGFLSSDIPGWLSPYGYLLPEPLIAWSGGYPTTGIVGCIAGLAIMRWAKAKRPAISNIALSMIGIFSLMVIDLIIENIFVYGTGMYAYLGAIRSLSINAGKWYQFPLYEALLFGGWWGVCAVLLYFKDDKGLTWVERGVDKIDICKRSNFWKGIVRTLAIIGFCQVVEVMIYVLPMQFFAVNGDPFPEDTPAYFINGMCGPGTTIACPRAELPISRRADIGGQVPTLQISPETGKAHLNSSGR